MTISLKVIYTASLALVGVFYLGGCAQPNRSEPPSSPANGRTLEILANGFRPGANTSAGEGTNQTTLKIMARGGEMPFTQSAIRQSTNAASIGPDPKVPYFRVRCAMPIPPSNATNNAGELAGIDPLVFTHNHSPGFEILPNGDALAVYFSTPPGKAEADPSTSFVQARLRHGAEEWDPPELFFKTKDHNDQSGLLWMDHGKLWFFGGGRDISPWLPFRLASSADHGATWECWLPSLDKPADRFTAQPITSAFRAPDGAIYMAMDGDGAESLLWRSTDDGVHWHDMGGRTGGRHSAIVPLDAGGHLLSIGGKNNSVDGWSPQNISSDWGASWSSNMPSPFPPLGTAQRPSLIRLANGNLFLVSDAYMHKLDQAPPVGWKYGNDPFVALSTNNGASWHIKPLPLTLPHHKRPKHGSVGYVTARQAPNGVIHILTSVTQPCLHYELNEAWVWSAAREVPEVTSGGEIRQFSENYPNGQLRAKWTARICPDGRYLLEGTSTDYYENGHKQHEATFASGRKTGTETLWSGKGVRLWTWECHPENNTAIWTHYWKNGAKRLESHWKTRARMRDADFELPGLVADGPALQFDTSGRQIARHDFKNGEITSP